MYFTNEQIKENVNLLRRCKIQNEVIEIVSKKFSKVGFAEIQSFLNVMLQNGTAAMIIEILREQFFNLYQHVAEHYSKDKMMHFILEWDRYCLDVLKQKMDSIVVTSIAEILKENPISKRGWLDVFAALNEAVFEISQSVLLTAQKDLLTNFFRAQYDLEMSETGLLLLGGACLAQTQLLLKNRAKKSPDMTLEKEAFDAVNYFNMTIAEKNELYDRLDDSLLMRKDRGHMLIPKLNFLPFLRSVLSGVGLKANNNVFEVYGIRTPEICHAYIEEKRPQLFNLFTKAAGEMRIDENTTINVLRIIFDNWVSKLVNSRISEWFKAKQVLDLEDRKCRMMPEGCQSLRQRLYAFVHDD